MVYLLMLAIVFHVVSQTATVCWELMHLVVTVVWYSHRDGRLAMLSSQLRIVVLYSCSK